MFCTIIFQWEQNLCIVQDVEAEAKQYRFYDHIAHIAYKIQTETVRIIKRERRGEKAVQ